jgi:plasmid stabilization system protein ParE
VDDPPVGRGIAAVMRPALRQRIEAAIDWYREAGNPARAAAVLDLVEGECQP